MKRIFTAIMVCAAGLMLASCAGSSDKPEKVADAFVKAYIVDVDSKEMLKYTNEEGAAEIQDQFIEPEQSAPEFYAAICEQVKAMKLQYEMKDVKVEGTTATVTYVITSQAKPDFKSEDGEVTLTQGEDKKWKVSDWDLDINVK